MKSVLTRKEIAVITTALLAAFGYLFFRHGPSGSISQQEVAHIFICDVIPTTLERFRKDVGRYPTQEEGFAALASAPATIKDRWQGPYVEVSPARPGLLPDPWGHDYVYRCPSKERGKSYDLICRGPTGKDDYDVFTK